MGNNETMEKDKRKLIKTFVKEKFGWEDELTDVQYKYIEETLIFNFWVLTKAVKNIGVELLRAFKLTFKGGEN